MDIVAELDPENLEQEALDAAAEASSLGALADVRIRFLGRASLTIGGVPDHVHSAHLETA